MSESEYPHGPLPTDLEATLLAIIRDIGVAVSEKVLRKRVEAHYKIEFTSHQAALLAALRNVLATPEVQLLTAKAKQEKEKEVGGKGKKRGRSPSDDKKKSKKDKKEKEKKVKREKKPEDYPKPALSAFFIFCSENRERLRKEDPGASVGDIGKKLGSLWKDVSPTDAARFQKLAEADKARHEREMEAYLAKGGKKIGRHTKKAHEKRKKPDVKRALSAYMYFAQDFRNKHSDLSMTEQMRQAGAAWKTLSDAEKAPFEAKANKDKERYAAELAAHKSS